MYRFRYALHMVVLAGGAVIALLFDTKRVTRDVDDLITQGSITQGSITQGHGPLTKAAQRIAGELGVPRGSLNEGVAVYLSTQSDPDRSALFDHPHLIIYTSSTEHMLALKARAARAQDLADLRLLADDLSITAVAEVLAVVERFFPNDPLSPKAHAAIQDLFD